MTLKPLLNRVAIKQDEIQSKTNGGLILPDSAKEKPLSGTIVAKGEKANLVKLNDKVYYEKYRGAEVSFEGSSYLIMQQEDILAIV